MKKTLITFIFLFISILANGNEKISKLNQLYLNGVVDKLSYFSSLEKMGINTSNDIFMNLFDLFSDNTLDISAYEKSLNNLITLSNNKNISNVNLNSSASQETVNNTVKTYKITNCKGDQIICNLFSELEFSFFKDDQNIIINMDLIKTLVNSTPELVNIIGSKNFSEDDRFSHIVTLRHRAGILVELQFIGYKKNDTFEMVKMNLTGRGREFNSAELELI